MTIVIMIWSYLVILNYDVKRKFELYGDCGLTYSNETLFENETSTDDAAISCATVNMVEHPRRYQTWKGGESLDVIVFPFAVLFAFMLLSIYVISSMGNPAIMFVIAKQYDDHDRVKYT